VCAPACIELDQRRRTVLASEDRGKDCVDILLLEGCQRLASQLLLQRLVNALANRLRRSLD